MAFERSRALCNLFPQIISYEETLNPKPNILRNLQMRLRVPEVGALENLDRLACRASVQDMRASPA